ncbi:MAG: PIN domain-containing protein [Acidobacteriota bacterium]
MTVAVDTNVLLDLLTGRGPEAQKAEAALVAEQSKGELVICEIVYAELAAAFGGDAHRLDAFLGDAQIRLLHTPREALATAGRLWRQYRTEGGPRTRVVADFLVAAHALAAAEGLLTRDRGFYAKRFKDLRIITP